MDKLAELKLLILTYHNNIKAVWEDAEEYDIDDNIRIVQKYIGTIEGILITASVLLTKEQFETLQEYDRLLQNKPNL